MVYISRVFKDNMTKSLRESPILKLFLPMSLHNAQHIGRGVLCSDVLQVPIVVACSKSPNQLGLSPNPFNTGDDAVLDQRARSSACCK